MLLIDTGFLLAMANTSDALHSRAMLWSRRNTESQVVTEYVLWETINFLSKRVDRARGHRMIQLVRNNPQCSIVPATPTLFEAGLELHKARSD